MLPCPRPCRPDSLARRGGLNHQRTHLIVAYRAFARFWHRTMLEYAPMATGLGIKAPAIWRAADWYQRCHRPAAAWTAARRAELSPTPRDSAPFRPRWRRWSSCRGPAGNPPLSPNWRGLDSVRQYQPCQPVRPGTKERPQRLLESI